MSLRVAVIVFLLFPTSLHAQSLDSLNVKILSSDPFAIGTDNKLDSIHFSAAKEYYSLKNSYDSVVTRADDQINRLQRNIDSLGNLQLHTDRFTHKLDSIQHWKDEKIKFITSKIDKLKSSITKKIEELDLPPALRGKASELTLLTDKLDITLPNANLPVSFQENLNMGMPNVTNTLNGQPVSNMDISNGMNSLNGQEFQDVINMKLPSSDMETLRDQVLQYDGQVAKLPTDMDGVAKFAGDQATDISSVSDVQKELGDVAKLTDVAGTLQDQEQVKKQLTQAAQKQAVDHFAGKEDQLKKAMESVSKYKQKFPDN